MTTTTPTVSMGSSRKFLLVALTLSTLAAAGGEEARVLADLPGFDFSSLSAPAKKELSTLLTDEFDYCGRPMTLLGSLKKGDACKHTKRLVGLAAREAAEGTPASEIIVELSRYNQSFANKRINFKIDERTCSGPKDAKVTIVEYSDFECPYCNAARPMLEEVLKKRSARLCWSAFPLSAHPNSTIAGQAALYARDNGKFRVMHDLLFDNQTTLSEAFIKELMKKAGLDVAGFEKAVAAGKYVDELKASKDFGMNAGVDSTPTLYFNGRKYSLGFNVDTLLVAIDEELEWQAGKNAWPGN